MSERGKAFGIIVVGGTFAVVVAAVVLIVLIVADNDPEPVRRPSVARPAATAEPDFARITPAAVRSLGFGVLPPVVMPLDNPATDERINLGLKLFFDPRMSANSSISCATCHQPAQGWGDGIALNFGYPGTPHWRNSQTILNSVYRPKLFWAGESLSLEKQAKSAWTGATAQNLDPVLAEERLRQMPEYVKLFNEAFGANGLSFGNALRAVAAFESTIVSRDVPFDRFLQGDETALTDSASRGFELFTGKAGCSACHSGPQFTDEKFHALAVPEPAEFSDNPFRQITFRYQNRKRGVSEDDYRTTDSDLGLFYVTKEEADRGRFRTPTIREVGQTGPYMHNGAFDTLQDVVEFYNAGGGDGPVKSPLIRPLGLTTSEVLDVVAFMESLTGDPLLIDPPDLPQYEVLK